MRSELRGKAEEARGLRNAHSLLREGPGRRVRFRGGWTTSSSSYADQQTICGSTFAAVNAGFALSPVRSGSGQTGRAEAPPHPVRDQRTAPGCSVPSYSLPATHSSLLRLLPPFLSPW